MADTDDRPFLELRIQQENDAAARAARTESRAIHLDLANRYKQLLSGQDDGSGQRVVPG